MQTRPKLSLYERTSAHLKTPGDMGDRIDKLTERQLECLKLKWQHRLDKEIALQLGLSVRAVEDHLRLARERLGVTSTRSAVAIVAEKNGWVAVEKPQPLQTTVPPPSLPVPLPSVELESEPAELEDVLRDAGGWPPVPQVAVPSSIWPLSFGEKRNDLSVSKRLLWPLIIAVLIPLLAIGTLASSAYVGRTVDDIIRLFR